MTYALHPSGQGAAAAYLSVPSNDLTDRVLTPVLRAIMEVEKGEFVPGWDALSIFKNGELIGAVGGNGAAAQEDWYASPTGVEALQVANKF